MIREGNAVQRDRLAANGDVSLLLDNLIAPNGIAFSPDEKTLYLGDGDPKRSARLTYTLREDGTLGDARVMLDVTETPGLGGADGLEADRLGNVFGAGRESVFVLAADGTHLGTILMGSIITNLCWGEDGSMLFITTERRLLRLRTAPAAQASDDLRLWADLSKPSGTAVAEWDLRMTPARHPKPAIATITIIRTWVAPAAIPASPDCED